MLFQICFSSLFKYWQLHL